MDSREIWKENYDFKETEFASHLADNHVLFVKMSTKHFGSVATGTLNFYAHLIKCNFDTTAILDF